MKVNVTTEEKTISHLKRWYLADAFREGRDLCYDRWLKECDGLRDLNAHIRAMNLKDEDGNDVQYHTLPEPPSTEEIMAAVELISNKQIELYEKFSNSKMFKDIDDLEK